MKVDTEYAIKKDIRNNPVVREVDRQQKRDFSRMLGLAALIVAMLLFSAWQHYEIVAHGYQIEQLRRELASEVSLNRKLRLELETWQAPQRIERVALEQLKMIAPDPDRTLVIEQAPAVAPDRAIVAEVR